MIKPTAILLDLDGTLFDDRHRLHLIQGDDFSDDVSQNNYEAYHQAMSRDRLHIFVKSITNNLSIAYGAKIIILTSRPIRWEKETREQLTKYNVLFHELIMRRDDDLRTSPIVKGEAVDILLNSYDITAALEDRDDVIEMFRRKGIFSLKPFGSINP